jgi:hypothetical protein
MLEGLFIAWILNQFEFGNLFIQGIKELFNIDITIAGYYIIFFIGGLIVEIIEGIFKKSA